MTFRPVLIVIFIIVFFANDASAQSGQRPNILFVFADDWSYGHAGIYGDDVVRTPNIDSIGKEGAVFANAFCAAPSCTPSRASILTGRYPHELEAGVNLWGYLPKKFSNYAEILQQAGYHVGMAEKGWGPGNFEAGGYRQNPAGRSYDNFADFMADKPEGRPFCFWFGSHYPHRPYENGSGAASGADASEVKVPAWLPDVPEVRNDILDYYYEVEKFDGELGQILNVLKTSAQFDNTLIIISGDNGMPFPRAKANLYDAGTRVPLIISMKDKIKPGIRIGALVNLMDLAPTILEVTGQEIPGEMTATTLWPLLRQEKTKERNAVFTERERHANVRAPELGYPSRAIRTAEYLYIRNFEPGRWPAGDPQLYHSVGPYGDIDASPSKNYILEHRHDPSISEFFTRGFSKRPEDELYDLKADPDQLKNVASDPHYKKTLIKLKKQLSDWQARTGDPRANDPRFAQFDQYPYFGGPAKGAPSSYKPPLNK